MCRLDGPQLVLDGKCYHCENLHTLPDDLNTKNLCSRTNEETVAFFGELHPFSNFHQCNFSCKGQQFHSSEQSILWKKAEFFGDAISQERILNSEDALDCKNIARDIRDYNKSNWTKLAESVCYNGLKQKFEQNPHLKAASWELAPKYLLRLAMMTSGEWGYHLLEISACPNPNGILWHTGIYPDAHKKFHL